MGVFLKKKKSKNIPTFHWPPVSFFFFPPSMSFSPIRARVTYGKKALPGSPLSQGSPTKSSGPRSSQAEFDPFRLEPEEQEPSHESQRSQPQKQRPPEHSQQRKKTADISDNPHAAAAAAEKDWEFPTADVAIQRPTLSGVKINKELAPTTFRYEEIKTFADLMAMGGMKPAGGKASPKKAAFGAQKVRQKSGPKTAADREPEPGPVGEKERDPEGGEVNEHPRHSGVDRRRIAKPAKKTQLSTAPFSHSGSGSSKIFDLSSEYPDDEAGAKARRERPLVQMASFLSSRKLKASQEDHSSQAHSQSQNDPSSSSSSFFGIRFEELTAPDRKKRKAADDKPASSQVPSHQHARPPARPRPLSETTDSQHPPTKRARRDPSTSPPSQQPQPRVKKSLPRPKPVMKTREEMLSFLHGDEGLENAREEEETQAPPPLPASKSSSFSQPRESQGEHPAGAGVRQPTKTFKRAKSSQSQEVQSQSHQPGSQSSQSQSQSQPHSQSHSKQHSQGEGPSVLKKKPTPTHPKLGKQATPDTTDLDLLGLSPSKKNKDVRVPDLPLLLFFSQPDPSSPPPPLS